jgi:protein-S-isoprenylcysteine O-methyltransferase Ste14
MNADSAHQSKWKIAEVIFGIPFLLAIAVQFVFPLSLPQGIPSQLLIAVGIICAGAGITIIVLARREFARFRQPTDPGHPTSKIVTTGVFSLSRNPLYLSCVLLLCGIALAFNSLWILAALLFSSILCHYVLIIPEEKYLAAKFGDEYAAYTAVVRRWFGRK